MTIPWLTARPIAHRGLHDKTRDVMENTASAARAAVAGDFAIECDVQWTRDGEAVVFHDFELERLTHGTGAVAGHDAAALARIAFKQGADSILPLADYLALIAGKVPLVCEIKSRFDADMRLTDRVAAVAAEYKGPLALKSFDPAVVRHLRRLRVKNPLGIVALRVYDDPEWAGISEAGKYALTHMLHFNETRPDFLSYWVGDLPSAVPMLCRAAANMPVMTWTVRTQEQREVAGKWADQMVFERFMP